MTTDSKGHGGQVGAPAGTIRKPLENIEFDWMDHGACLGGNVDFFPLMNDLPAVAEAKDVCHHCPVFIECLNFATDNDIDFGIWGGKTPSERAEIMAYRVSVDNGAATQEGP